MIQKEQQLIRTAIVSLLVVLALVYLLVYSVYYRPSSKNTSDTLTGSESPQTTQSANHRLVNTATRISVPSEPISVAKPKTEPNVVINSDTPATLPSVSPTRITRGSSGISAAEVASQSSKPEPAVTPSRTTTVSGKILPDTTLVAHHTIADELGVKYDYTLQDMKGIYYVNLGSSTQDLGALLQRKGGTTFALTTPTKILANQLFGSRVVYLNLPAYKNKTVLMVITIGSERWFIQVPYAVYHSSKKYLAERFR